MTEGVKLKKKHVKSNKCKNCKRLKAAGFNAYYDCESLANSRKGQNEFVSTQMGKKMANDLKISKFMEISPLQHPQVPVIVYNYSVRIHRNDEELYFMY